MNDAYEAHEFSFRGVRSYGFGGALTRNSTLTRQRVALCTSFSAHGFLFSYLVLHALHVAALDPSFLPRISPIPLFAILDASAIIAPVLGLIANALVRKPERILRHLPFSFVIAMIVFVLEVVLWP
jgi:hypothetical protein